MKPSYFVFLHASKDNSQIIDFFSAGLSEDLIVYFILIGAEKRLIETERRVVNIPLPEGYVMTSESNDAFLTQFGRRVVDILCLEGLLVPDPRSVFLLTRSDLHFFGKALKDFAAGRVALMFDGVASDIRNFVEHVDIVLCKSLKVKHQLIKTGVNKEIYSWVPGVKKPKRIRPSNSNVSNVHRRLFLCHLHGINDSHIEELTKLLENFKLFTYDLVIFGDCDYSALLNGLPLSVKHNMRLYGRLTDKEILILIGEADVFIELNEDYSEFNFWIYALCSGLNLLVPELPEDFLGCQENILASGDMKPTQRVAKISEFFGASISRKKVTKKISSFNTYYYEHKQSLLLEIFDQR